MNDYDYSVYEGLAAHMTDAAPAELGLERDHTFWHLTLDMGRRYEAMYLRPSSGQDGEQRYGCRRHTSWTECCISPCPRRTSTPQAS
jgi:hypothetical protein